MFKFCRQLDCFCPAQHDFQKTDISTKILYLFATLPLRKTNLPISQADKKIFLYFHIRFEIQQAKNNKWTNKNGFVLLHICYYILFSAKMFFPSCTITYFLTSNQSQKGCWQRDKDNKSVGFNPVVALCLLIIGGKSVLSNRGAALASTLSNFRRLKERKYV